MSYQFAGGVDDLKAWTKFLNDYKKEVHFMKGTGEKGAYQKLVKEASALWHAQHGTTKKQRAPRSPSVSRSSSGRATGYKVAKTVGDAATHYTERCRIPLTEPDCKAVPGCTWMGGKVKRCQRGVGVLKADAQAMRYGKGLQVASRMGFGQLDQQSQAGGYWF